MTKREAVKGLDRLKTIIRKESNMQIALNMAIEALEQEETLQNLTKPNKRTDKRTETHACDLISRQAAIDALDTGLWGVEWDKALATAMLKDLPSAQPFTEEQIQTMQELESAQIEKAYELGKADRLKWIPCGERLPKKDGRYQVTRYDYVTNTEFIDILWYEENLWWNRHSTGDYAVTAWMPLPEAYREDGEEE